ncbi:MAG TPA: hypothetical protein VEF04_09510 [Blastocatellia bacterium]|nr:hypothetical protein [Blastocatellia bacterium]
MRTLYRYLYARLAFKCPVDKSPLINMSDAYDRVVAECQVCGRFWSWSTRAKGNT